MMDGKGYEQTQKNKNKSPKYFHKITTLVSMDTYERDPLIDKVWRRGSR
jgi:hypothetical protein